jgi:hypothetical protein
VVDEVKIVVTTLEPPPKRLGVSHWSSRLLARELGVSTASIIEVWHKWGLQPWRRESFKFCTDPKLEAKLTDVVGLYLHPPENAVVVCVDEKSQIQALDRTQPVLPLLPGLPERATHGYIRHGVTTLFAALDVATGQVVDACYPRHRHQEFLRFLKRWPPPGPASSCTWSAATTPPTTTAKSGPGWPAIPGSPCTSRPPGAPGSTWWRSSSRSSPARPSAAAPTALSKN